MSVQGIGCLGQATGGLARIAAPQQDKSGGGFGEMLGELVQNANEASFNSDKLTESLAKGEPTDIHQVMIAMTEADTSFRLLVEVRNRLVDAYQEIQRMPV